MAVGLAFAKAPAERCADPSRPRASRLAQCQAALCASEPVPTGEETTPWLRDACGPALAKLPRAPTEAWRVLYRCFELGELEGVRDASRSLVQADPGAMVPRVFLALSLESLGDPERAIGVLGEALALPPSPLPNCEDNLRHNRAMIAYRHGDHAAALADLEPVSGTEMQQVAVLIAMKRYDRAAEILDDVLSRSRHRHGHAPRPGRGRGPARRRDRGASPRREGGRLG